MRKGGGPLPKWAQAMSKLSFTRQKGGEGHSRQKEQTVPRPKGADKLR